MTSVGQEVGLSGSGVEDGEEVSSKRRFTKMSQPSHWIDLHDVRKLSSKLKAKLMGKRFEEKNVADNIGNEPEASTSSSIQLSQQCRRFELYDIMLATKNFDKSSVIGRGGFGKVYIGTIFNGSATVLAAVKRLDPNSNQGAPEFWAEVEMLSKLRHCNLVSLFGYCNDEEEMILVYEYMPYGTLEDHLHKLGTLSWVQRLRICIGAGRGLHYLHTGTGIDVGVIHRDVKTSNILLQESWAAKISDFGLSKIGPTNQPVTYVNILVKGTFGYFDPDYYATGNLTRKSDVFAFGVVLLEVLCRKRAVFNIDGEASNLANWAQESIKEGNLKNIVDIDIRGQISQKCLKKFIRIAERCLHGNSKQRSTMAEVLVSLEAVLTLQEKFNNSMQTAGRTIVGRVVNMLPFHSNRENTGYLSANHSATYLSTYEGGAHGPKTGPDRLRPDRTKTELVQNVRPKWYGPAEEDHEVHLGQLKGFHSMNYKLQLITSVTHILGRDGFGKMYKGRLADGTLVAVKRLKEERTQGLESQFQTEGEMISMAVHRNLLRLRGFCETPTDLLLVYPYMANGSVASCLRGIFSLSTISFIGHKFRGVWMCVLKVIEELDN
uniref:Serine/threonine/dual specificity protein kinase, catalytic domain-containing protein n=1 Tax=Tanacetum cinerariifolium TaxID=118510 RepID=A0A699I4T3_TANCI|nr:serine/threonine/dual specificity protein kinase, catalytic domain-containing protein [Tanacetum cinerariifolium]